MYHLIPPSEDWWVSYYNIIHNIELVGNKKEKLYTINLHVLPLIRRFKLVIFFTSSIVFKDDNSSLEFRYTLCRFSVTLLYTRCRQ